MRIHKLSSPIYLTLGIETSWLLGLRLCSLGLYQKFTQEGPVSRIYTYPSTQHLPSIYPSTQPLPSSADGTTIFQLHQTLVSSSLPVCVEDGRLSRNLPGLRHQTETARALKHHGISSYQDSKPL